MLAILLRGIGWQSGTERDVEDTQWEGSEDRKAGISVDGKGNGQTWGGGGGCGGLLIHGPTGSGKTHLIHALATWCSTTPYLSSSEQPYLHFTAEWRSND